MNRTIYADNAATTRVSDRVLEAMLPFLREQYGNPSSLYTLAGEAKKALERARDQAAAAVGAKPQEIYFTSCGTEADNWAVKGMAMAGAAKGKKHLISTAFEHHAVLKPLEALEKQGFDVTLLPVHENGLVRPEDLEAAIRDDTALVSVMFANNEIGAVQPIKDLAAAAKAHGVPFHTDAVQAMGSVPIDVDELGVDMLSLSGHKIHAPKGVGVLYIRRGVAPASFMDGGAQERNCRGGTENMASIVGLGVAMEEAAAGAAARIAKLTPLREKLMDGALRITHSRLNGDREKRLCGNANFSFEGVEGESLLLMMDLKGVACSSGSACTSGSLDPSHVLLALGLPHEVAHGSLRLTLGDDATEEDVDYILEVLPPIIKRLRSMSPLWEEIIQKENSERR